jgi:hypothetical protein
MASEKLIKRSAFREKAEQRIRSGEIPFNEDYTLRPVTPARQMAWQGSQQRSGGL